MCSFFLNPVLLIAPDRFVVAVASAECSIIMTGPHDELGIPVFGYYGLSTGVGDLQFRWNG